MDEKLSIINPNPQMKNVDDFQRVLWFVLHGVKYKNYKEHSVLEVVHLQLYKYK